MLKKLVLIILGFSVFGSVEAKFHYLLKSHVVSIDSPEIDLLFPISDPLDPTNFSQGLIDFDLPLNINNNVNYDPNTGQYIFNSLFEDSSFLDHQVRCPLTIIWTCNTSKA